MESMINLFNRHKEAGTCGFASWCEFVAWLHSAAPDKAKLGELKELSAKAYAATFEKPKKTKPPAETTTAEPTPAETIISGETDAMVEEEPKPKKRKPKSGE